MLQSELSAATIKLADQLTKDIQELGSRTNNLEEKNGCCSHGKLKTMSKTENRSHCSNMCLRGIPETLTDLTSTALFQELVPLPSL